MEPDDEGRLLDALRAGSRPAAEELARRTYRQTFAVLCRLTGGREELAADLTQETYRRAWAGLDSFQGGSRFATWLYRIAYTTFLNHIRRPNRLEPLAEPGSLADPGPSQRERFEAWQQGEALRRAVLALPEDQRYAVSAHYWGGLSTTEIARSEKVGGAAIRKRLRQARATLRLQLQEDPR